VAYKYITIWKQLKSSMPPEVEITIHEDLMETVIQGVKRTKSAENVSRAAVGLVPWSKLVIEKELLSVNTRMMKVRFKLLYDTRL